MNRLSVISSISNVFEKRFVFRLNLARLSRMLLFELSDASALLSLCAALQLSSEQARTA